MEHFYHKTEGEKWFNYQELYAAVVSSAAEGAHFVEVGSWKGMSACHMAVEILNSGKKLRFDCVDLWEYVESSGIDKSKYPNLYETFLKNIKPVNEIIGIVRSISWEAASRYENRSLDFVFIDATHDYDSVSKDVMAWYPRIRSGGIIAGHDYNRRGVRRAVNEFFHDKTIETMGNCWIVRKFSE